MKIIAIGVLGFDYELTWAYIFKSQLLMLSELNRKMLTVSEVREFYNNAATENPIPYAKISFEQWLHYLKTKTLVIHHPSEMFEITVRGRDFLKYLVHCGHSANERAY